MRSLTNSLHQNHMVHRSISWRWGQCSRQNPPLQKNIDVYHSRQNHSSTRDSFVVRPYLYASPTLCTMSTGMDFKPLSSLGEAGLRLVKWGGGWLDRGYYFLKCARHHTRCLLSIPSLSSFFLWGLPSITEGGVLYRILQIKNAGAQKGKVSYPRSLSGTQVSLTHPSK